MERASQEWRKAPFYFKRDALLSGEPLFQAKRWIATKQGYLQRDVNRFVKKSLRRKRPAITAVAAKFSRTVSQPSRAMIRCSAIVMPRSAPDAHLNNSKGLCQEAAV